MSMEDPYLKILKEPVNFNDDRYKLRPKDFIPLFGIINYGKRNKDTTEYKKVNIRFLPLMAYNTAVIGASILYGLEKLLK